MNLKARPLWELDEDVTQCRLCDTQFNFWKRRVCELIAILIIHLIGELAPLQSLWER